MTTLIRTELIVPLTAIEWKKQDTDRTKLLQQTKNIRVNKCYFSHILKMNFTDHEKSQVTVSGMDWRGKSIIKSKCRRIIKNMKCSACWNYYYHQIVVTITIISIVIVVIIILILITISIACVIIWSFFYYSFDMIKVFFKSTGMQLSKDCQGTFKQYNKEWLSRASYQKLLWVTSQ